MLYSPWFAALKRGCWHHNRKRRRATLNDKQLQAVNCRLAISIEALADRTILSGSPFAGKTGDIVPVDFSQAIPDGDDFELIGFDVVDGSERTALRVDVTPDTGDLALTDGFE